MLKRIGTTNFSTSIVSSLLGNIDVKVTALGLSISLADTEASDTRTLLTSVAQPLDDLTYTILSTLGVYLGEADVRVYGIRCGSSVLAK